MKSESSAYYVVSPTISVCYAAKPVPKKAVVSIRCGCAA